MTEQARNRVDIPLNLPSKPSAGIAAWTKPARRLGRALPAGICLALAVLLTACETDDPTRLSVTGLIEGGTVSVGSLTGGRVAVVRVSEGDAVSENEILIELEADDAEAALAAAQAQLAQARAVLTKAERGARPEQLRQAEAAAEAAEAQYALAMEGARGQEIEGARAALSAATAQREDAEADLRRAERLYGEEVISERDYQRARTAFEAAMAQERQAREQLDALIEGARAEEIRAARAQWDQAQAALDEVREGARIEDIEQAQAAVEAAEADVRRAERGQRETVVRAPAEMVVESLDVRPGDLIQPGPVARLVDPGDLTLTIYVSAAALGHLRLNQPVELTTDAHGGRVFKGRIIRLATEGEFTPRNLQTQEERVQQVFGVKIRIEPENGLLRAGMAATAHLRLNGTGAE